MYLILGVDGFNSPSSYELTLDCWVCFQVLNRYKWVVRARDRKERIELSFVKHILWCKLHIGLYVMFSFVLKTLNHTFLKVLSGKHVL